MNNATRLWSCPRKRWIWNFIRDDIMSGTFVKLSKEALKMEFYMGYNGRVPRVDMEVYLGLYTKCHACGFVPGRVQYGFGFADSFIRVDTIDGRDDSQYSRF